MTDTDPTRAEDPRESAEAPADPGGAGHSADDWSAQLAAAEARAEEQREAYLRAAAEIENLRRRAAREVESARQFGAERLAGSLLPVVDSLELGLKAADKTDPVTLIEGQQATLRLLLKALEAAGISELDPTGQTFDPNLHEAMVAQPSADHLADTVLTVVQKGYVLNGRLLRPARVIVARAMDA